MLIRNKFNGYGLDGRRIYRKGGDGGAGAAQEQEKKRQKRIDAAVRTINSIFDSAPSTKYDEQKQAVYDINAQDVNKQYAEAERQNRFGLARSGLLGGSADVDSNAELQERTNKGLIQAAGIADGAAADLKMADERSRQSLISLAQSGIDTGTAQTMALNQLNATAQDAQANRAGATVGSLFGDLSQAYLANQIRLGTQNGLKTGSGVYGAGNTRSNYAGEVS